MVQTFPKDFPVCLEASSSTVSGEWVWLKPSCFTEGVTGTEEEHHQVLGYRWDTLCAVIVCASGESYYPCSRQDGGRKPQGKDCA